MPRSPTNLTGGDFCFRLPICERCFASEVAVGGACIRRIKEMVVIFVERNVQRFRGVRRARVSGGLVLQIRAEAAPSKRYLTELKPRSPV